MPRAVSQSTQVRSLRWIVAALLASNIIMGAVSVMLLRSLDRRYTDLINRTVPALNDLRSSSSDALATFRTVGPSALLSAPQEKRGEFLDAARKTLAIQRKRFAAVLASPPFAPPSKLGERIAPSGTKFENGMDEFIRMYGDGKIAEATAYRESTLRPIFDAYLDVMAKTADAVEAEGLKDSDSMTETMTGFSKIMIALASWPLLVMGGLLLVTCLFFAVLMLAFRGKENAGNEAP